MIPVSPTTRRRPVALGAALLVALGAAVAAPVAATAAPVTPAAPAALDTTDKAAVTKAFQSRWAPALQTPTGWTGSTATCTPGVDSAAAQTATLNAVNFARSLAGRPAVTMDPTLSAAAMQAALISQASGSLNHSPGPSSACYTSTGAAAAGRSNLYGVASSAVHAGDPIAGYLRDDGAGNQDVGHRRWILFSRQARIGSGTTTGANALYVLDSGSWLAAPAGKKVAAWPSAGYFPASMEPAGRWSVSVPGADFSNATVTVKKGGATLATTVVARNGGYGDPSLVWSVDPRYDISQGDKTYTVTVQNYTVGGLARTTRYTTTLFDATVGMAGRNVIAFPYPTTKKVGVTFDPGATDSNGLAVYYFTSTPGVCKANFTTPATVTTLAPGTCTVTAYVGHDDRYPDAESPTRSFTVSG